MFQDERWVFQQSDDPIITTAVHQGHDLSPDFAQIMKLSDKDRQREEDPMTGALAMMHSHFFVNQISRFEVDLNRSKKKAVYQSADDAWGLDLWHKTPSEQMIKSSLKIHDRFYTDAKKWLENSIAKHGKLIVLDIHAYNHLREGYYSQPSDQEDNPDIDLGITTADHGRFDYLIEILSESLKSAPAGGRELDVRHNVRYPDGGHWPEWIYHHYGDDICTITLEYKKFYMNEWTGHVFLPVLEDLKRQLKNSIDQLKSELRYDKAS